MNRWSFRCLLTVGFVGFTFSLIYFFFMVESRGPGSDAAAAAVARLLPRPRHSVLYDDPIFKQSLFNTSKYSCFCLFSRGTQSLHDIVHLYSPLVLGVGRHKVAPTKMFILSASTTYPFELDGIYSRKYVPFFFF